MSTAAETISVDRSVFDLDTVKRAAYRLSGRASVDISQTETEVVCRLTIINSKEAIETVVADFKSEILDQDLRARIRQETAPIRNAILALAFSPVRRE